MLLLLLVCQLTCIIGGQANKENKIIQYKTKKAKLVLSHHK